MTEDEEPGFLRREMEAREAAERAHAPGRPRPPQHAAADRADGGRAGGHGDGGRRPAGEVAKDAAAER